jgi:hypothetical protein
MYLNNNHFYIILSNNVKYSKKYLIFMSNDWPIISLKYWIIPLDILKQDNGAKTSQNTILLE